jgi:hypothetical protein
VVFSSVHLDSLSLAGVAHRLASGPHASGPRWRLGISFQYGPLLHAAGCGAGALLSGWIANRIFYLGAALLDFKIEIAIFVVAMQVLVLVPLLLFAPQLARAKRTGRREYGTLAEHYVQEFDTKWLRGAAPANEPLVGSADIQSLADLSNSYQVVQTMRITPVTRDAVVSVAAMTLAPVAPLLLTMMSLEQLLKKLFAILL